MRSVSVALFLCACSGPIQPPGAGGGGGETAAVIEVRPAGGFDFGQVTLGETAALNVTVRNVGSAPLHLVTPVIEITPLNGAKAELSAELQGAATIAPHSDGVQVALKLAPTSPGRRDFEVVLFSDDPVNPVVSTRVGGEGVVSSPCLLQLSPASVLSFGPVGPNAAEFPVTVTNLDPQHACELSDVAVTGDSALSLAGGPLATHRLEPSDVLTLQVRVTPEFLPRRVEGVLRLSAQGQPYALLLSGELVPACLTLAPSDLNFGTVMQGCSSVTRTVAVYNLCDTPVRVIGASMAIPGGTPARGAFLATRSIAAGTVLSPGGTPGIVNLKFHPARSGSDYGVFRLSADQNGVQIDYDLTLSGNGDTLGQNVDTFKQEVPPKADILLVIDSSASMASKQSALVASLGRYADYLVLSHVDFQVGVTSSDLTAGGGRIVGDASHPKVLSTAMPDFKAQLLQKIAVIGVAGDPLAQTLAAATAAITPPISTTDNFGLIRPNAALVVISVGDSDDQSPGTVASYVAQWPSVKAVSFNAVGPISPGPLPGCSYDGAGGAPRLVSAAGNGIAADICRPNWEQDFEGYANVDPIRTRFYLSAMPNLGRGKSIAVTVDGVAVPALGRRGEVNWTYSPLDNAVSFPPPSVPPGGSTLKLTYDVACLP
jgi:hypothetical protein